MKYQYVVILKKTGQRATDLFSFLLCFTSICSFAFIGVHAKTDGLGILVIALLLLVGLGVVLWMRRRMRSEKVRYRYLLLLAAMGWMFFTPASWVGALFLLLTFLEFQTKRPLEIGFDIDRVVINTLFRQQFDWTALITSS